MARALVWIRDDLRLDDHLALRAALEAASDVALLAVLDPRSARPARIGDLVLPRVGRARAEFWRESLLDVRGAARERGGELFVRTGVPAEVVPSFAAEVGASTVFAQAHVAHDEVADEKAVAEGLAASGRALRLAPGRTLVHLHELPFQLDELPDVFTAFRKEVEARAPIHAPRPAPERLPAPPDVDPGDIPMLDGAVLGPRVASAAGLELRGGETAGRAHLERWMFEHQALAQYKETRNGLMDPDDSSKLSPWLAHGCLSPRRVAAEIQRYERLHGANDSTYWLLFELLWRDYFALLAAREGARLFRRSGIGRRRLPWSSDVAAFEAWRTGRTGYPFVDAFMRELAETAWMSNRGRQNVASFLAKTLRVDWRWGAAWFEATLVDYDPASNWGSWQYVAGVGTDPRDRVFDVVKQAFDYDPDATFVRRWVPEVAHLAGGAAHRPWEAGGVADYPGPIVPLERRHGPGTSRAPRRGERRPRR